jgi:hypothetical protein
MGNLIPTTNAYRNATNHHQNKELHTCSKLEQALSSYMLQGVTFIGAIATPHKKTSHKKFNLNNVTQLSTALKQVSLCIVNISVGTHTGVPLTIKNPHAAAFSGVKHDRNAD